MKKVNINRHWLFGKFEDSTMEPIDLPHDAMIHEKRDPAADSGGATGFLPGGKYIYVKDLIGLPEYEGKKLILEFEGIYMDSSVYLNGELMGGRLYGYSNFFVDITGKLRGGGNELKVIVDNSVTPNSRWYSGSGIYRDVNLWVGGSSCIKPEGIRVKTLSIAPAMIKVTVDTENADGMNIRLAVLRDRTAIAFGEGLCSEIAIPDASLWSAETPNLYTLRAELMSGSTVVDIAEITFGIRTLSWNPEQGFRVNGQTVKLRGGCIHHDHGILGACAYEEAEYRRVTKLKKMGFNAIRYAHNPAGKSFLKACDELGMYVIDESFDQWKVPQSAHDYALYFDAEWEKDVASMVSKDYNHPSVIMYGVGNEITDTGLPFGGAICQSLCARFKELDDTRPTMLAINSMLSVLVNMKARQAEGRNENSMGSKEVNDLAGLFSKIMASITPESLETIVGDCARTVDIVGYNYGGDLYAGIHNLARRRVILSSETFPQKMAENWALVEENSYVIGDFHWTAWDYLGEAGVGLPVYGAAQAPFSKPYPCLTASCGSFDMTGFPESAAYYVATLWGANHKPYIGVRPLDHAGEEYTLGKWRFSDSIPCWTWPGHEGKVAQVEVFSEGAEVALTLNGILVEQKLLEHCRADFTVSYAPGILAAVSHDEQGKGLARVELETAGPDTVLCVEPEETFLHDLAFVPVVLRDSKGTLKMTSAADISILVEGPGTLLAFGCAKPDGEPDFYSGRSTTWNGRALAVIQSTGKAGTVRITASAPNLASASAEITAR